MGNISVTFDYGQTSGSARSITLPYMSIIILTAIRRNSLMQTTSKKVTSTSKQKVNNAAEGQRLSTHLFGFITVIFENVTYTLSPQRACIPLFKAFIRL